MKRIIFANALLTFGAAVTLVGAVNANSNQQTVHADLTGIQEAPAVSTQGFGSFRAKIDEHAGMITYSLEYAALEAPVQQAHLHLGERHESGGVSVFLCSNLGNGPAGTQPCPPPPAEITGAIMAGDVIGPVNQGIAAGEFAELLAAIRAGAIYVNVHSEMFPLGEIRGQLK